MYVYESIKRTKENPDMSGIKFLREVRYDHQTEEEVIERLTRKVLHFPGVWRIYRSVNRRDPIKAKLELAQTLMQQLVLPDSVSPKNPETLWKDILMSPKNKAERLFLVDIDTKDADTVREIVKTVQAYLEQLPLSTPNGYHITCTPFDPRLLEAWDDVVSVKKDALLYLSSLTVVGV